MFSSRDYLIIQAQNEDKYLEAQKEQLLSQAARQRRDSRLQTGIRMGRTVIVVFISLVLLAISMVVVVL